MPASTIVCWEDRSVRRSRAVETMPTSALRRGGAVVMMRLARRIGRGLLALIAPCQCAACGARVGGPVALCRPCARRLRRQLRKPPPRGLAAPAWLETAGGQIPLTCAGPYAGVWAQVVRAYKSQAHPSLDPLVAGVFLRAVRRDLRRFAGSRPWLVSPSPASMWPALLPRSPEPLPPSPVLPSPVPPSPTPLPLSLVPLPLSLVPVPMARVRRRERGWNPPERLCRIVSDGLECRVVPGIIRRVRYRRPLRGLDAEARRREVEGAFRRGEQGGAPAAPEEVFVLVDDVVTTGSTLRAAVAALPEEARARVRIWTLAWAPPARGRGTRKPRGADPGPLADGPLSRGQSRGGEGLNY